MILKYQNMHISYFLIFLHAYQHMSYKINKLISYVTIKICAYLVISHDKKRRLMFCPYKNESHLKVSNQYNIFTKVFLYLFLYIITNVCVHDVWLVYFTPHIISYVRSNYDIKIIVYTELRNIKCTCNIIKK